MAMIKATIAILTCMLSLSAWAACEDPVDVDMPDGATASTQEMLDGQGAVKKYIEEAELFLECMVAEEKDQAKDATDEEKSVGVERYNSVVDKMESIAATFNEQIRAYKAAQ